MFGTDRLPNVCLPQSHSQGESIQMSLKKLILFGLIAMTIITIACGGETLVTKVNTSNPGTQRGDGVLFSLPKTVVVAEVPLTKIASSPGSFAAWTEFFYPEMTADDFVTEQKTVFKVGAATFNTRGQTDPEQVYIAHIKSKLFETKTLLLEFNEDGIVARTEASSKDDTIDIVTSGIKTTASIVAPLLRGGGTSLPPDSDIARFEDRVAAVREILRLEKIDCRDEMAAWQTAGENFSKATEKANRTNRDADIKAAEAAQRAVDAAFVAIGVCNEQMFTRHLNDEERALYESLDSDYKAFLRENFGYQFLTYIVRKGVSPGGTGIQFFFTLNEDQQKFIREQDRSSAPCEISPRATINCMATQVKLELLKAKTAYDKIVELQKKREELLFESTGADVNTSSHLEFRLKELDAQIKSLQENFFFGTATETSGSARFEFTPGNTPATRLKTLFTYSRGGSNPGVCVVTEDDPGTFKALVPAALKGDCHDPGFLVSMGDFRDSQALINRLKNRAGDHVSREVYRRLNATTQVLIDNSEDDDTPQVRATLLNALINDLRPIVEGRNIYTDTLFQDVELSPATIDLRAKVAELAALPTPTTEQAAKLVELTQKLNRSLLDDAYADELYRQTSWVSHEVKLEIGAGVDGLAQTVQTARLQQNGNRGFPYRLAAVSLAKVTDDGAEKGRKSLRIAQFGEVQTLPANLGGRRSSYKITYYDETGAIRVFDMSSDALIQKGNVTDLTDAVTTLRDSEAAGLERDAKLLELKKKKIDAEKALKDALKPSPTPTPEP